jgi:hypothetical protein
MRRILQYFLFDFDWSAWLIGAASAVMFILGAIWAFSRATDSHLEWVYNEIVQGE